MANVGKELALISAGTKENFNAMTIGFGAIGTIWRKDAYFAFVKPERYAFELVKSSDYFTDSFFPKEFEKIHKIFGFKSGRDCDQIKESGLNPEFIENGTTFAEAKEIFICEKMYFKQLGKNFAPAEVVAKFNDPKERLYGEFHYKLIGEIEKHIVR